MRKFYRLCLCVILLALLASPAWAQNAVYLQLGTAVTWLNTGGDEELDLGGGDAEAGEVLCGSDHDWGADPRPSRYYIEFFIDGFATAPVVGETVDLYISQGEGGTNFSGPLTLNDTTDTASSTVVLPNLLYVGSNVVTTVTAADNILIAVMAEVPARYWAPCVHNNTADALLTTGDAHSVTVYPIYDEIQ